MLSKINDNFIEILFRIDDRVRIKVLADFGLSKSAYEKLYCRQDMSETVKLPIKWLHGY